MSGLIHTVCKVYSCRVSARYRRCKASVGAITKPPHAVSSHALGQCQGQERPNLHLHTCSCKASDSDSFEKRRRTSTSFSFMDAGPGTKLAEGSRSTKLPLHCLFGRACEACLWNPGSGLTPSAVRLIFTRGRSRCLAKSTFGLFFNYTSCPSQVEGAIVKSVAKVCTSDIHHCAAQVLL